MKNLKKRREKAKLSQSALARKAGISQGALSHFESGNREPRLKSLRLLAAALECDIRDLL